MLFMPVYIAPSYSTYLACKWHANTILHFCA